MSDHPNEPVRKVGITLLNAEGHSVQHYVGVNTRRLWRCESDGVLFKWTRATADEVIGGEEGDE